MHDVHPSPWAFGGGGGNGRILSHDDGWNPTDCYGIDVENTLHQTELRTGNFTSIFPWYYIQKRCALFSSPFFRRTSPGMITHCFNMTFLRSTAHWNAFQAFLFQESSLPAYKTVNDSFPPPPHCFPPPHSSIVSPPPIPPLFPPPPQLFPLLFSFFQHPGALAKHIFFRPFAPCSTPRRELIPPNGSRILAAHWGPHSPTHGVTQKEKRDEPWMIEEKICVTVWHLQILRCRNGCCRPAKAICRDSRTWPRKFWMSCLLGRGQLSTMSSMTAGPSESSRGTQLTRACMMESQPVSEPAISWIRYKTSGGSWSLQKPIRISSLNQSINQSKQWDMHTINQSINQSFDVL